MFAEFLPARHPYFYMLKGPNRTRRLSTNSFQVGSPRHATNKFLLGKDFLLSKKKKRIEVFVYVYAVIRLTSKVILSHESKFNN